ncbi:hypothetical protein MKW92_037127 [Papaver armeniacum]|nr:hypothetical protein MKW92_037127 [Papaver armeniacum]
MFRSKLTCLLRRNKTINPFSYVGTSTSSSRASNEPFRLSHILLFSSKTSCTPFTRNAAFYGFRSLHKGFSFPSSRRMCTAASISPSAKEGVKLLVTAGPHAQKMVGIWLFGSAAWVFSMVILGGVTRLTRSGLSMTDWKFTGGLPPMSDEEWLVEFEKYKQSPEYKRVNKGMNIEDFKFIYWMEYAHRMWGRGLGIMFALPFSYFVRKGYMTVQLGVRLSALFALGAGQGLIGWWMVKSGLEEPASEYVQPRVSPYRLAAHLTSAFGIYCGLLWTALSVVMPEPPSDTVAWVRGAAKIRRLAIPVSFVVGITAISGAFVAGNDAGHAFNTFPKMGDTWIPEDILSMEPITRNFFENTATVQFDHRILATATLLSISGMWWATRKLDIHPAIRSLLGSTMGMAALQVTLGISTLLSYVPVSLGSAHQAGALTLLSLMILLSHTVRKPSPTLLKSLSSSVTRTANAASMSLSTSLSTCTAQRVVPKSAKCYQECSYTNFTPNRSVLSKPLHSNDRALSSLSLTMNSSKCQGNGKFLRSGGFQCHALDIKSPSSFLAGEKFQLDDVIEAQQFDLDILNAIFEVAREMENIEKRSGQSEILKGYLMSTLFYEPSTRTRLSFESAMKRLGGEVLTTENAREFSSAAKGETLEDTIRTVEGYSDIIVMRHFESGAARRAAGTASIPIINAGDGPGQHPTQALLDVYTIEREIGKLDGIKVGLVGDLANGRTVRSLAYLLAKYRDVKIYLVSPDVVKMKDDIKDYLTSKGVEWEESADLIEVASKCDVVYQTRIQKERFGERIDLYEEARGKYIVDRTVLDVMQKHAVVMHPLPRLDEITVDVDADPRAAYFRQAKNGLYIRMALLKLLLVGW